MFSVIFTVLSLTLLFGSSRTVSLGVFVMTVCCALAMTNMMCPTVGQWVRNVDVDQMHNGTTVLNLAKKGWMALRVKAITLGIL